MRFKILEVGFEIGFVACVFVVFTFYIIPLALDRELYRLQIDCKVKQEQGYGHEPCRYWEGQRP